MGNYKCIECGKEFSNDPRGFRKLTSHLRNKHNI